MLNPPDSAGHACDVKNRYCAADAIIPEVTISDTHSSEGMGTVPTGRRFEFALCAALTFDGNKLAVEKAYFDRVTIFEQMGILLVGQVE